MIQNVYFHGKISGENTPASDITLTNFSLEKITE